jgi:16S rRNA (cytosine1402-N4)-methyltransferase
MERSTDRDRGRTAVVARGLVVTDPARDVRQPDSTRTGVRPTVHQPVLLRETLSVLELQPGLTVVDGTVGAGGHSRAMASVLGPQSRLLGIDRDPSMLARAATVLSETSAVLRCGSYVQLPEFLQELQWPGVDRVLLDLGLSSDQLADADRGFSFQSLSGLDLRFNPQEGISAAEWLQRVTLGELTTALTEWAEEPASHRLAAAIVTARQQAPILTGQQLADIVSHALGPAGRGDRHPATRVFQALRIAVNQELQHVQSMLSEILPAVVKPSGLVAVISFHSLEDRLVKQAFRDQQVWDVVTAKPIVATPNEQRFNPRSRSAKLRCARRRG